MISTQSANPFGISQGAIEAYLRICNAEQPPKFKVNAIETELNRLGLSYEDKTFFAVAKARHLLELEGQEQTQTRTIRRATVDGRSEEGAEVTIGRKASTTAMFTAAGFARWVNDNLYNQLCGLASNLDKGALDRILVELVS